MNTKQYELDLFKQILDWVTDKKLATAETFVPHYGDYYTKASTHTPILSEDWGQHNLRHGPNSIRGTTSELLTACALASQGYDIKQITNKTEQKYGSDLRAVKGAKEYTISVKTCKPKNVFTEGKLDTQLLLFREYFNSAEWRVDFLSLAHPETKQVFLFNYGLLGNIYCKVNEQGLFTPTFPGNSVTFSVYTFFKSMKNGLICFDLSKE